MMTRTANDDRVHNLLDDGKLAQGKLNDYCKFISSSADSSITSNLVVDSKEQIQETTFCLV